MKLKTQQSSQSKYSLGVLGSLLRWNSCPLQSQYWLWWWDEGVERFFFFFLHHGFILRASQQQTCWNLGEEIFAFECCFCMLLGSLIWKLLSLFICFYGKCCCHLYKGKWIKHQIYYPKIIKKVWVTLTNPNTCFMFILKAYTKDKDKVLYIPLTPKIRIRFCTYH